MIRTFEKRRGEYSRASEIFEILLNIRELLRASRGVAVELSYCALASYKLDSIFKKRVFGSHDKIG
jgi:hypothetical protein